MFTGNVKVWLIFALPPAISTCSLVAVSLPMNVILSSTSFPCYDQRTADACFQVEGCYVCVEKEFVYFNVLWH
jgi:hypothetical protein